MPHTRAARLRALEEAAESRDLLRLQNSTSNIGWNDYSDWDLPELIYYPHSLAWFPTEGLATFEPQFPIDTYSPAADATYSLPEPSIEKASKLGFCGLQPWYSTGLRKFSSTLPTTTIRPQLSGSEFNSYESKSLDEEYNPADQSHAFQSCSPNIRTHQLSSVSDGSSGEPTVDLIQELDNAPSHASEDEDTQRNTTRVDASKKRKTAHSVTEKKYRSRLNDGMAELRHCVPSTARGRSSLDSKRPGSPHGAHDTAPSYLSGKLVTLSDAVQYVKSLELEKEGLYGQLDVMQRRNNTLQRIALSMVDTNTPATPINKEACTYESISRRAAGDDAKRQNTRHSLVHNFQIVPNRLRTQIKSGLM